MEKRAKVTSGTNAVFNNDGIRPTQWVSETQWSATLFRLPVTRAKGDKQKGSNKKKEDVKQSSFCCDLQAKSYDVDKGGKEGKSNKWHKCGLKR